MNIHIKLFINRKAFYQEGTVLWHCKWYHVASLKIQKAHYTVFKIINASGFLIIHRSVMELFAG